MIDNKLYLIRLLELKNKLIASGINPEYVVMHTNRRERFNKALESQFGIPKHLAVKFTDLAGMKVIIST